MNKLAFMLLAVVFPCMVIAHEFIPPPTYDTSLLWQKDVEKLLRKVYQDAMRPVEGAISSRFGSRIHPVFGVKRHHQGIDIACAFGSEVRAVLPGVVRAASREGGYGKMVMLRHVGNISETRYAHLSRIVVTVDQQVAKGELLGYSGKSGITTGPHLHFEMTMGGKQVDPERYLLHAPAITLSSSSSGFLRHSSPSDEVSTQNVIDEKLILPVER